MDSFYGSYIELSDEWNSNDGITNILDINKNDLFNNIDIAKIKNENYENDECLIKIPDEIRNNVELKKTFQTSKTPFLNFTKIDEINSININKIDNNINDNCKNKNKNTKYLFYDPNNNKNEKLHTKGSIDNIIQKLRRHLIKFGIDLLNDSIKKEFGKKQFQIRYLNRDFTKNINIDFNKKHLLNLKLDLIYSNEINGLYKKVNLDENEKQISKLRLKKNKAPLTNELLDKNFYDLYNIYINKNTNEIKEKYGLKKAIMFDNFIKKLEIKESKIYIEQLKYGIKNFYNFFLFRNSRKVKKTNKIKIKI